MRSQADSRAKQAICFGGLAVVTMGALILSGAAMGQNALWALAVIVEVIVIFGCFLRLYHIMQSLKPQGYDRSKR